MSIGRKSRVFCYIILIMFLFVFLVFSSFIFLYMYYSRENSILPKDDLQSKVTEETIIEDQLTHSDTIFIWNSIDRTNQSQKKERIPIPDMFVGLDRTQFNEKLEEYNANPPLSELEKGFSHVQVYSFSPKQVFLKAFYEKKELGKPYYAVVKEHYVVIYYNDLETVYMDTGIPMEALPDNLQLKIIEGYLFETEADLYNFLESYTS